MTAMEMLGRTSRTFGLAIPLLPDGLRNQVALAYLVFRIADTLEDAERLDRGQRLRALGEFESLVASGERAAAERFAAGWAAAEPTANADYRELLSRTPEVLDEVWGLDPRVREPIERHARRSIRGMAEFVAGGTPAGHVQLESLDALREYCYVVAGMVGELLTELFLVHLGELAGRATLWEHARHFGEGLQLVNILKDAAADAREGRIYLPVGVARDEVFRLAEEDLARAEKYVQALYRSGAPAGCLAFTVLPLRLATATLAAVRREGPGAKVPRQEVERLMAVMTEILRGGRSDELMSPELMVERVNEYFGE